MKANRLPSAGVCETAQTRGRSHPAGSYNSGTSSTATTSPARPRTTPGDRECVIVGWTGIIRRRAIQLAHIGCPVVPTPRRVGDGCSYGNHGAGGVLTGRQGDRVVPMPCDMTAKAHLENCPMWTRLCPRACVNRPALHRANGPTIPRPTPRSQHPPLTTRLTPGVGRSRGTQPRHAVTRGGDDAC